ncbi:MAG: MBL fold metallo-hydrolase [Methyloligellaceae bacterium]
MSSPDFHANISDIRSVERLVPGQRPQAINVANVAASIRPFKFVVEGGDDTPTSMPRTAYQLVYEDGTVMLDSGLNKATHDSFSDAGNEPYDPPAFMRLKQALDQTRLIIFTHYHADHVAGVLTAENFTELARKTMITRDTADFLVNNPHRPHLKLSETQVNEFVHFDYETYLPVAPGVVMIKAPGHSPDSQIIFIRLASGREILHVVDSAWNMENITREKGKAAPWVKEDKEALLAQLKWLNGLRSSEPDLTFLITHDESQLNTVTEEGIVGRELRIS